jgi:hypothetical protein
MKRFAFVCSVKFFSHLKLKNLLSFFFFFGINCFQGTVNCDVANYKACELVIAIYGFSLHTIVCTIISSLFVGSFVSWI